ncbi:MAG TPA: lytic transglycosylase domain-containing protein [Solirubrobacteraceae bacterium]|jgi:soluble lytic murein transglycosylase-like protein|nr:lytic transglycosylase domain-containing protein [Solirubrobacteraceae bacterium]
MSAPVLAATAEGPVGAVAATERMQQLQTLIAQVERGPAGFAAALSAAQAEPASATATTGASADAAYTQTAASGAATTASPPYLSSALDTPGAAGESALAPSPTGAGVPGTTGASVPGTVDAPATSTAAPAGSAGGAASAASAAYEPLIAQAAARNGVDPAVLYGLIEQESGFDPSATSSAGALGLTQLMPGTAASLGVTEPLNPAQSIEGGARYLGEMLRQFAGNTAEALAAYNAGPGAVQQYGGVPPYSETQQYVSKVLANAAAYSASAPAGAAALASARTDTLAAIPATATGGVPAGTAETIA